MAGEDSDELVHNIFEANGVGLWKRCAKLGHVTTHKDKRLQCVVYRVSGGAGSSLLFPQTASHSLNLTHKYLYCVFIPTNGGYWAIHSDCVTSSGLVVRMSVSNSFKQLHSDRAVLHLPYTFDCHGNGHVCGDVGVVTTTPTPNCSKWTILVFDLQSVFKEYFTDHIDDHYGYLKAVQLTGDITVKGLYTSNVLLTPNTLPRPLTLPITKGMTFYDNYDYIIVPTDTIPIATPIPKATPTSIRHQAVVQGHSIQSPSHTPVAKQQPMVSDNYVTNVVITTHNEPQSDKVSMLKLLYCIGIGPCYQQCVSNTLGSLVFYCCNSVVVAMDTHSGRQQFLIGHTDKIASFDVNDLMLASIDTRGVLRLWDTPTTTCVGVSKVTVVTPSHLRFSPDSSLVGVVGTEHMSFIGLYEVPSLNRVTSHASVVMEIRTLLFISNKSLVTCGRGNIRIWRIKDNKLKSSPVDVEAYHDTMFTDICRCHDNNNIYVSSNDGLVFEVNTHNYTLLRVWDLQCVTINSITCVTINSNTDDNTINSNDDSYCVTASADGIVRVWSSEFTMVVMETDLESPVMSVGVGGANTVTCVTQSSLGTLQCSDGEYSTLIHCGGGGVAISCNGSELATCTTDSIQLWTIHTAVQLIYQFSTSSATPTALCYVCGQSVLVWGCDTGLVGFISIATDATVKAEHKLDAAVVGVASQHSGRRVYVLTTANKLIMFDTTDTIHYPILDELETPTSGCGLTVSPDDSIIACGCGHQVVLYDAKILRKTSMIDTSHGPITDIHYTPTGLLILTNTGLLLRDSTHGRDHNIELVATGVSCVDGCGGMVAMGNQEGLITLVSGNTQESFIGHSGRVRGVAIAGGHVISYADEILVWACQCPVEALPHVPSAAPPTPMNEIFLSPIKEVSCDMSNDVTPNDVTLNDVIPNDVTLNDVIPNDVTLNDVIPNDVTPNDVIPIDVIPKPHELFIAPVDNEVLKLQHIIGYTGSGRGTLQWHAPKALLCYASECVIVVEQLRGGEGRGRMFLRGHHTPLTTLALQNDGCGLASASRCHGNWTAEVRVWDLEDNQQCSSETLTCPAHQGEVTVMAYSPDNRFLVAATVIELECSIVLWSCYSNELLISLKGEGPINDLSWDPAIAYEFVTVGVASLAYWRMSVQDNTVDVKLHKPEQQSRSKLVAVSYSNNKLFVGSEEGVVSVWSDKCHVTQWTTGISCIEAICSSCDGTKVVVGGAMGVVSAVQLWEGPVLTSVIELPVGGANLCSMIFDTDLRIGMIGTRDHTLSVIDWEESSSIGLLHGHHGNITSLDVIGQDSMVTSDDRGTIVLWDIKGVSPQSVIEYTGMRERCVGVAIQCTDPLSIVCGYQSGRVMSCDTKGAWQLILQHRPTMTALVVAKSIVISSYTDGRVLLSAVTHGNHTSVIADHKGTVVNDLSISKEEISLPGVSIHQFQLLIICSVDGRISVWKIGHTPLMIDWISFPRNKATQTPPIARFKYPDSILYTNDNTVNLYSLTQRKVIKEYNLTTPISSMCLSHDYQLIALGRIDQVLTVVDADEWACQDYHAHSNRITNVLFTCQKHLYTISTHYIHVWEVVG